jgi:enterochelin esterase-like enzyme
MQAGSQEQKEIKEGEVIKRSFTQSAIYPGTTRDYWIYIPHEYTPNKPACLYVGMDGIPYNAPTVLDSLLAAKEVPVMIGVFVSSGTVFDTNGDVIRFNRSNEFDKMDDTFARFILEELLPDFEKHRASDGRPLRLSKNPNDRMLSGNSSGAICAFTLAWQRPDMFRRVFSAIGTYVPMRGGNEYPPLIRKTEPKPLRIFLQDGTKDTWNPLFGSWYEANVLMESALRFAGYDIAHEWGTGGHDDKHAAAIFPNVMRWLWRDWPEEIKKGISANDMLQRIIDEEEPWEKVDLPFAPQELIANSEGDLFSYNAEGMVFKLDKDGQVTPLSPLPPGEKLRHFLHENKLCIHPFIHLFQEEDTHTALFPNHKLLMQTEMHSHWIYSSVIGDEGKPVYKQRWYWLHNTDNRDIAPVGNICFDTGGNLYAATAMGIQVCDQNGRVRAILTLPSGSITSVCFGGNGLRTLYAVSQGLLYKRKLNASGVTPDMPPIQLPPQGMG